MFYTYVAMFKAKLLSFTFYLLKTMCLCGLKMKFDKIRNERKIKHARFRPIEFR